MRPVHLDPDGLRLAPYRGGLAVLGPSLDAAFPDSRSPNPLHITLLTPAEAKAHPTPTVSLEHIYVLGVVTRGQVTFAVVVWVHGNAARRSLGLEEKDFHVTLSATDAHDIPKGLSQLPLDIDGIAALGLDALDHVFLAAFQWQTAIAERMVTDCPASFKGYVRLAAVSSPKTAGMALARAATLNPALRAKVAKELRRRSSEVSYGPTLTEAELASIPTALLPHLYPWPDLGTGFWPSPASDDAQVFHDRRLPDGFSFIYPRICSSSAPRDLDDVRAFEALGVTHILTLTAESWLPQKWFDDSRPDTAYIDNVHVPVAKGQAPTLAEMDAIFTKVKDGGTWLVHGDAADDGRAGVVLTCLVAMLGEDGESEETPKLDAATAIGPVRQAKTQLTMGEKQERFVSEWVAHRWSLDLLPEPRTPLEVSGDITPRALILIGQHGAGKSWFAKALAKRSTGSVMVVGEDHGESGAGRLRDFASFAQNPAAGFVVLDRCNTTKAERASWLAACDGAIAVWFDYEDELCEQRVRERIDDPRTRFLRGLGSSAEAGGEVDPPTLDEFAGVLRISSFAAAREALERLSPMPTFNFLPAQRLDLTALSDDWELKADPRSTLVVEEKLSGSELFISLDAQGRLQVRTGSADDEHAVFDGWLVESEKALRRVLNRDEHFPERLTLSGVSTEGGPFFASDLYDRAASGGPGFVSREVLERLLCGELPAVPVVRRCQAMGKAEALEMLEKQSAAGCGKSEGIAVRWEEGHHTFKTCEVGRGPMVRTF